MMKSPVGFDVTSQWRVKNLTMRSDPVQNGAFQTLCVIRSCARSTLLDLGSAVQSVQRSLIRDQSSYKLCNMDNVFVRAFHQPFFDSWYHLKQGSEDAMLSSFPDTFQIFIL